VLAGGDMPELVPAVLGAMLDVARSDARVRAVALAEGDRFRPLPSVVRVPPALEAVSAVFDSGERRLRGALAVLEPTVLDEREWVALDPDRRTLFDVDEPTDLVR
jgi:CTP:molybdopterin cytidylyltransferase MocA